MPRKKKESKAPTGNRLRELRKKYFEAHTEVNVMRFDLPSIAKELEEMYNELALLGKTPSDKVEQLIIWIEQEARVLEQPEYDPTFTCEECGR